MKINYRHIIISISVIGLFSSCNTLEKASTHGFISGYYKLKSENKNIENVYLDVTDDQINVYQEKKGLVDQKQFLNIPLKTTDSLIFDQMIFKKQSLDFDLTSIIFKYRPSVYGLPEQLTTDLNIALYTGWRHDSYEVKSKLSPLGKSYYKINNRGYDFGIFAGPGTTLISPFTTRNNRPDEYNGMIIQGGIAGFIELSMASFGVALGYDYLLSQDRNIWIYNNKPWVGFVVGIALN
ncbi:hypothetical protein D0X99_13145 [Algoriphagus lacus]|uniref:Uncharacterized protein n=1 Tax=Algoriphagus lacus TaxID=2056311 RepID=A0A418PQB1_9BACT|nr:hypothetical protein [Algoriphagus lacus]RIW14499.1 hypothetical protein D0X99_13145 [Algoriphagus lacus]